MSRVIGGGGLARLSAAAALGSAGYEVECSKSRPFSGGRGNFLVRCRHRTAEDEIDNSRHILLRCCVNLLDFYRRFGVENEVEFYREFYFLEPGGRKSVLKAGILPAPFHFTGSFLAFHTLSLADNFRLPAGLLAVRKDFIDAPISTASRWLIGSRLTKPTGYRSFSGAIAGERHQ